MRAWVILIGLAIGAAQAATTPAASTSAHLPTARSTTVMGRQAVPDVADVRVLAAYNTTVSEVIQGYIALIGDQELNALFLAIDPFAADVSADDRSALLNQVEARLAALRVQKAPLDAALANLPEKPPAIGQAKYDKLSLESRDFAERVSGLVDRTFAQWDAQIAALRAGDLAAYNESVNDEMDSSTVLLEAENGLARLQQAAQQETSPIYWHFEAIVAGNEALMAFIEIVNGYEMSTAEEDAASLASLTGALDRMDDAVTRGSQQTSLFCVRNPGGTAGSPWQDLCGSFQRSDRAEGRIRDALQGYGRLAEALVEQRFGEAEQQELVSLEQEFTELVEARVALQMERVPMGQALLEAMQ